MRPYPPGLTPVDAERIDRFGALREANFEKTPAVIVGAAGACGLGLLRSLRVANIPVVILDTHASAPAMRARQAHGVVVRALAGRALVDELLALRQALPGTPLLFLTSDEITLTISQFRNQLAAGYRIRLPAHERLVALMHKTRFQELAEAHGFAVPRSVTIGGADDFGRLADLRFPCVVKPAIKTAAYFEGGFARGYRVASRAEAEAELRGALDNLARMGAELSARRQSAAAELKRRMETELKTLGMRAPVFEARFAPLEKSESAFEHNRMTLGPGGADAIEFMLSPNLGQPPMALARIASGGELSRVMLALKRLEAQRRGVATMIFDEVDAGVGGAVAQVVGRKLKELARFHQVLCVTHLPQVAAFADTHFLVEKEERRGATRSRVSALVQAERIEEVARMLGGAEVTDKFRRASRELIERARA